MSIDAVAVLKRVPLFSGLKDKELDRLARQCRERPFDAGATMVAEGQPGVGFFVLLDGTATVTVGGETRRTLSAGDWFGEIALIDEGMRTATVTAETPVRCLGMTSWEFRPFVEHHPEVTWPLLQALARRVRELDAG